jgi:signal transduction histidine kinase
MPRKYKSLRNILISIILLMGLVSAGLIAVSESIFHQLVRESEQAALSDLVWLKVDDLINEHFDKTKKLGLSLQGEPIIRKSIQDGEVDTISKLLNSQFHQYFVTAGIIDLKKIYVLDKEFNYLAESTEVVEKTGASNLPCMSVLSQAKAREGAKRLRPMYSLCSVAGQHYNFLTIVPIGTLSPKGYIVLLTDFSSVLENIERDLGIPVLLRYPDGVDAYQSAAWNELGMSEAHISVEHELKDENGNVVLQVFVRRNVAVFQQQWDKTGLYVLLASIIFIVLAVIGSLFVLRKGLSPLEQLRYAAERLSQGIFQKVSTTSYPEIDIPIQSFNHMAEKITQLIEKLEGEIQERKSAEEELKEHRDHLEELVKGRTEDLAIARDEAMAASSAKGTFLANMSHELRTPLNAIIGYSELAQEDIEDGKTNATLDDLERIIHSGRHLSELINGILDLSKIEAGKMEVEYSTFEMLPFLRHTVDTVRQLIEEKNNTFELDVSKDIYQITSDHTKLRQSIINLLSNAAKFTSNGSVRLKVTKEIGQDNDWIIFSVVDSGIGISKDNQDQLWTAFTQANSSTTRVYGGTGLGLSISKRFCEMMGGTIVLESEEGVGSTFSIKLPTDKSDALSREGRAIQA